MLTLHHPTIDGMDEGSMDGLIQEIHEEEGGGEEAAIEAAWKELKADDTRWTAIHTAVRSHLASCGGAKTLP